MMLHTLLSIWVAVFGGNDPANVTGLRVVPVADYTEVVIQMSGDITYSDFLLTNPPRLIVDLKGARHALPGDVFDRIDRGGVIGLRTSQFRDDVVRVVVDLLDATNYTVTREGGEVRISFPNLHGSAFEAWASGEGPGPDIDPASATVPASDFEPEAGAAGVGSNASEPPAPERARPAAVQERASQMPRITVTFEGTDIRDVLGTFAEFTGKSFVPGAGVEGQVTANIRNQPWDLALDAILQAHGLHAVETTSGIIRVDRLENLQERQKVVQLETQIFKINYAPVGPLAQSLGSVISERGRVIANDATNSLIVTDLPENIQIARQLINDLDVRTPQVSIAAKIIFVDRSEIEELGIGYDLKDTEGNQLNSINPGPNLDPRSWQIVDSDFDGVPDRIVRPLTQANQVSFSGASIAALANARDRITTPALQLLASAALGDFRLFSFVDALQRMDLSDIVAAPTVTTMDNQPANILVGEETPVRVVDFGAGGATGQGAGGGAQAQFPRATVEFKETGIKLEVTPHITNNRQIVMDLHAERSGVALAPGDLGFTFQTQEGTTRLILNDGETGVIGGLTVSEVTRTESGVPILMDLPLLGGLFRTTRSDENKRDLLILVTPHIVDGSVAQR